MNHRLQTHQPTFTRVRRILYLACLAAGPGLAALSASPQARAQEGGQCSNATLKGEYASYISGTGLLAGQFQTAFVGISLRKFDGNGNFTEEWASFHGTTGLELGGTAAPPAPPLMGTYTVNPNCTGTSTLYPPPFPGASSIVSDFVIMDNAKEVREIVTSPTENVVSADFKRVW